MKSLYAAGFVFLLSSLFTVPARAQESPQIYITEINWAGSELSTADEWIELFNASDTAQNLSGWTLSGSGSSGTSITIVEETILEPNTTLLISNYDAGHEKSTLNTPPGYVTTSLSLPNSHLNIALMDANGTVIDSVSWEGANPFGSTTPIASAFQDIATRTWNTSMANANLLADTQIGTPGVVESLAVATTEPIPDESINTSPVNENTDVESEEIVKQEDIAETSGVIDQPLTEEEIAIICQTYFAQEEYTEPVIEDEAPTSPETPNPEEAIEEGILDESLNEIPESIEDTEIPVQTFTSGMLILSEFVSDPETGDEWIELYNPMNTHLSLEGWSVHDSSLKRTYLPDAELVGYGFYVVEKPLGILNNVGDTIELIAPDGTLIDSITYGTAEILAPNKGESLARGTDERWYLTSDITKNDTNIITYASTENGTHLDNSEETVDPSTTPLSSEPEQENVSAAEPQGQLVSGVAKQLAKEVVAVAKTEKKSSPSAKTKNTKSSSQELITLNGVITAEPGLFGKQIAFMNGKQIYFHLATWPELRVGDTVRVTGELSESRGEPRIKISSADQVVITGREEVHPHDVTSASIAATPEGTLVSFTGNLIKRDGKTLTLQDNNGTIEFVAHENTGISWAQYSAHELTVTGVVRHIDGTTFIYPRNNEDIQEIHEEPQTAEHSAPTFIAESRSTLPWIGGGLTILGGGVLAYWYVRYKYQKPFLIPNHS